MRVYTKKKYFAKYNVSTVHISSVNEPEWASRDPYGFVIHCGADMSRYITPTFATRQSAKRARLLLIALMWIFGWRKA